MVEQGTKDEELAELYNRTREAADALR